METLMVQSVQIIEAESGAAGDELHLFTDSLSFHQLGHTVTTAVILCSAFWSQL